MPMIGYLPKADYRSVPVWLDWLDDWTSSHRRRAASSCWAGEYPIGWWRSFWWPDGGRRTASWGRSEEAADCCLGRDILIRWNLKDVAQRDHRTANWTRPSDRYYDYLADCLDDYPAAGSDDYQNPHDHSTDYLADHWADYSADYSQNYLQSLQSAPDFHCWPDALDCYLQDRRSVVSVHRSTVSVRLPAGRLSTHRPFG